MKINKLTHELKRETLANMLIARKGEITCKAKVAAMPKIEKAEDLEMC